LINLPIPLGILDPLSSKLLIKFSPPKDPQKKLLDFLSKMFTKLEVLEQSPSEESKLVSLNPIWIATSPPQTKPLKLNPLKCITNNSLKPFQETTSVSILKILPLKKSKEEMLPLMPKETHQEKLKLSLLKLLS
jgi:hypothetical protein